MSTNFDELLLAKIEAVKGTDIVPAPATDAIRIISAEIGVNVENIERTVVKPTMGQLAHLIGKKSFQLTVEAELRGSGSLGVAADIGTLLRICGLDETITGGVSVANDPLTSSLESTSIYWYQDGLLWKLLGAVGDVVITYEMNAITKLSFTIQAPFLTPTTVAKPGGEVYQTTPPIVASSADIISEGGAIKVGSFELALGNDVQEHYTTGQHEFNIADRQSSIKLSKDSVSTIADWTALENGTDVALSAIIDGGVGNKQTITADVARRKSIVVGRRAERYLRELEYGLYETTGDDAFQILFE
ncbi:MAG: hypothetical protein KAV87_26030 [Desulfobacteraceae bacterium]|nr:hypothetical protein [Desulfobacteraceae bacterium]